MEGVGIHENYQSILDFDGKSIHLDSSRRVLALLLWPRGAIRSKWRAIQSSRFSDNGSRVGGGAWPFKLLASRYGVYIANRRVAKLANSLMSGESIGSDFILYLRPHWLDGREGYSNPSFNQLPFSPAFWLHQSRLSLDQFMSLELNTAIIALGTKEMRLATGSIQVSDTEWQAVVARLISGAKFIFYVPDITPGMTWELSEIIRQATEGKVIIVQPPRLERSLWELMFKNGNGTPDSPSVEAKWSMVCEHVRNNFGLEIGGYQASGDAVPLSLDSPTVTKEAALLLKDRLRKLNS